MGVTEPAMFGINIKYIYPFVAAMIGSALAAILSVSSGVMANSIGVGGIPGFLSIQSKYIGVFLLCMLIAIVVPMVLTVFFDKKNILKGKGMDLKLKYF